jgi:hypothetical protein
LFGSLQTPQMVQSLMGQGVRRSSSNGATVSFKAIDKYEADKKEGYGGLFFTKSFQICSILLSAGRTFI